MKIIFCPLLSNNYCFLNESFWQIYHHIIILIYFISFGRPVIACNSIILFFCWFKPYCLREIRKVELSKYINIMEVMMMLKSSFYKPKCDHYPPSVNCFLSSPQSNILFDLWQYLKDSEHWPPGDQEDIFTDV